jgi:hypothetical protein
MEAGIAALWAKRLKTMNDEIPSVSAPRKRPCGISTTTSVMLKLMADCLHTGPNRDRPDLPYDPQEDSQDDG